MRHGFFSFRAGPSRMETKRLMRAAPAEPCPPKPPTNEERMNFVKEPIEAETSGNTTLRANGTGCRAVPCKMLTPFEDAHLFRKVSILENPDNSFEDAHPFPRCSPAHTENINRGPRIPVFTNPVLPPTIRI
jgi:hypothetical protein